MKVKVHMLAFMEGQVREVDVPGEEAEGVDHAMPPTRFLEAVFKWGQNDFQPAENMLCSVSVGDVIELGGRYWKIMVAGFMEMSPSEFVAYGMCSGVERVKAAYPGVA